MVRIKPLLEKSAGRGSSYYLIFDKKVLEEVFGWKKGTKLNVEYDGKNKHIVVSEGVGV